MKKVSPQDLQTLKILLKEKVITKDLHDGVIHKLETYGGLVDEVIMEIGRLDEKQVLSTLAAHYETKFVTSEKLKTAAFDDALLARLPAEIARKYVVFPIGFDEATKTLTVITPNLGDVEAVTELERTTGARKVRAYAARSETVRSAIRRWYDKDVHAFRAMEAADMSAYDQLLDVYQQPVLDDEKKDAGEAAPGAGAVFDAAYFEGKPTRVESRRTEVSFDADAYLATLQIMLGLIERERGDLKGHSVQVSRTIRHIGERLRLSPVEVASFAIAGLLHDMGKGGIYHLTTLNASQYGGHRDAAVKRCILPSKMFEQAALPEATRQAMDAMYERFDGKGFPRALSGKDIPLGARILAVADSFSDLTMNPRNPYRRRLPAEEAMTVIEGYKGNIFDPVIVETLKATLAGDKLRTSILVGQNTILIVDSDTEQGTVLDLGLANRGFHVEVISDPRAAVDKLQTKAFDLVVSEVNLEPVDGFELIKSIQSSEKTRRIPVMFYTTRSSTSDVDRGFALGAADYVIKPTSLDLLIGRIMKITRESAERAAAATTGVSGSLKEMDLPDLIQVLSQGRKTGKLKIVSSMGEGEIHFSTGQIVNAIFNEREGEEAFYRLLVIRDGYFTLDPKFAPPKSIITTGTEGLLLEAMRRLDESQR
jgi:response regulator RpfG family c-di-GMP phosphodiesterase/Arc/MetJ-type ribon-helix-helix transcriptional regulator